LTNETFLNVKKYKHSNLTPQIMKKLYTLQSLRHSLLIAFVTLLTLQIAHPVSAQNNDKDCGTSCFTSLIEDQKSDSGCITRTIVVNASNCSHALSHFIIEIPCGTITSAWNSGGWPMQLNSTDPKSGIYGLKIDDIKNFGEGNNTQFTVVYTLCSDNSECFIKASNDSFKVVYKAATCTFIDTLNPKKTPSLDASIVSTNILCSGANNGTAGVTVNGGVEPYSIIWNTGTTTPQIENLPAGNYTVQINDASGQQLILSTSITEPARLSLSGTVKPTECNSNSGSITTTISGGTPPYQILWNTGDTINNLINLKTGSYLITITDANGCKVQQNYVINEITTLNAILTPSKLACHEEGKGSIEMTATGGDAPYTYLWSNGATTQNITNVNSGRYTVVITDNKGCTITRSATISINRLNASFSVIQPNCAGDTTGSVSAQIINGTGPYQYKWSNGDTTAINNNISSGWYTFTVTDVNGCTFTRNINVPAPTPITVTAVVSANDCSGADSSLVVKLNPSGGSQPYTIYLNGQNTANPIIVNNTGKYTVTITDAKGCTTTEVIDIVRPESNFNATVTSTNPACNEEYGSASINVSGGISPYTAIWSDGATGLIRNDLKPSTYTIQITDAAGCSQQLETVLSAPVKPTVRIISPTVAPLCETFNNPIQAETTNVAHYQWQVSSDNNTWQLTSSLNNMATYYAGTGTATLKLTGTSSSGCSAEDVLILNCSTTPADTIPDDGGDDGDDDGGNDNDNPCILDCFTAIPGTVTAISELCLQYTLTIKTDGSCRHDLSHLVVGVKNGTVGTVTNTYGWKVEKNMTDPKSGIYGFKIDDISGFGKKKDEFTITFNVCYNQKLPDSYEFPVVFKAATCSYQVMTEFNFNSTGSLKAIAYPNPFVNETRIEFSSDSDTNAELSVFDLYGNKVETLFAGEVHKGITYSFGFKGDGKNNMFIYKLITPKTILHGKLLNVR
jgi:hypothetical protein